MDLAGISELALNVHIIKPKKQIDAMTLSRRYLIFISLISVMSILTKHIQKQQTLHC